MSYLVDALKKAERERHQQKGADMRSLSAGEESFERSGNSRMIGWIVAVLVVVNIAFLFYLLGPHSDDATASADDSETASTAPHVVGTPTATGASTAISDTPESTSNAGGTPATASVDPRPVSAASDAASAAEPPRRQRSDELQGLRLSDAPASRSSQTDGSASGRVTYADQPLDDSQSTVQPQSEAWRQKPAAQHARNSTQEPVQATAADANAPHVSINGHLYSSVPGRSFILVDGRRYHEGERLAAGPAVVSIDRKGATLNYEGRRYHVNGPS